MRNGLQLFIAALALGSAAPAAGQTLTSVRLTDYIKSTGQGTIDLAKNVTLTATGTALERYRQEGLRKTGAGALLFGVDINEAASGTEKASSQAVTLKSVSLSVTTPAGVRTYSEYSTKTQAVVTEAGQSLPGLFYTLLGDSGSNRITGANAIQGEFDSVLTVVVPDDLTGATAATLRIQLLTTQVSLGDPEAFYDFSNGFEDLALLNLTDADFLDTQGFGVAEAPAVVLVDPPADTTNVVTSWVYYPAQSDHYFVFYEDLYPEVGDYDFNDLVVAYQVRAGLNEAGQVVALAGEAFLVARGAGYNHNWFLRVAGSGGGTVRAALGRHPTEPDLTPVAETSFSGDLDLKLLSGTKGLLTRTGSQYVNTEPTQLGFIKGPKAVFYASLAAPIAQSALTPPFDPTLEVLAGTTPKIHLKPIAGQVDPAGFPFAMIVPRNLDPAYETVDFGLAYPRFIDFVQSSGQQAQDWLAQPDPAQVFPLPADGWLWPR